MIEPFDASSPSGRHALVIGGSIAGMLAARVLAGHFARVTIVERDRLPSGPQPRKGVPQARHVHVMLLRGQDILRRLFPGIDADLLADGAEMIDWTADVAFHTFAGWAPRESSGLRGYLCSRDLIEFHIRRRLQALPQVTWIEEMDVAGLGATGSRVSGVRLEPRSGAHWNGREASEDVHNHSGAAPPHDRPGFDMNADLVVDASGRSSRAPEWLRALGYAMPEETRINPFLGYSSRIYRRPPGFTADWRLLLVRNRPPDHRAGGIYPIEGDRWFVTLGGGGHDYPPTDEAGFLEFARSLCVPAIYEAIKGAEPLSPIAGYRRTENVLRHYERFSRWPQGFVALGDAVCAFNPVYGQGMTAAALGAETLAACLRSPSPAALGLGFQKRLARGNRPPWLMATGEDFRWPTTEGGRPGPFTRLLHRYFDRVIERSVVDPAVQRVLVAVMHLVEPPGRLLHPSIVASALLPGRLFSAPSSASRYEHSPRRRSA